VTRWYGRVYERRLCPGLSGHSRCARGLGGPPQILEALLRGEPVDPSRSYFRAAVYLETSAPRLAGLQPSIFVAAAVREADRVYYTAYRVT
jgi:Protein of unknown function (DUF3237)